MNKKKEEHGEVRGLGEGRRRGREGGGLVLGGGVLLIVYVQ